MERERWEREGREKETINGWEARKIGEITQQHNAQYFAIVKALRVGNPGKGKEARNARCWGGGGGRFGPLHHLRRISLPPTFANETIDNPQSIHVFLELNHL